MANARRYLQLLDEVEEQAGTMDLGAAEAAAGQICLPRLRPVRVRWI